MKFEHLHLHTEHSLLDGVGNVDEYAQAAKEKGFEYLGITDHGTIAGVLKFQQACIVNNIKPVFGCEFYIVPDIKQKMRGEHIVVLCKNLEGWFELCRVLTIAEMEGFYYKPRIDFKILLNADSTNWIILTGCLNSFIRSNDIEKLKCDIYLEIMPFKEKIQTDYHEKYILPLVDKYPLVASNDCHYVSRLDWKAQEMLLAIKTKQKWSSPDRWKFEVKGLYLRTPEEMFNCFKFQNQFSDKQIKQAMDNTVEIAKQCSFKIPRQKINLPPITGTKKENQIPVLQGICDKWFEKNPKKNNSKYRDRLKFEFKTIENKEFGQYFLIVWDLIQFCNQKNIMVGPGRGSVGGSLLAYILGITKIDPIKFNLFFSRFISDDRLDFPDIDLDFPDIKRKMVVEYLNDKYNTCGISTDSRMKKKAVLWDVGRVLEINRNELSFMSSKLGKEDELADLFLSPYGKNIKLKYPDFVKLSLKLENNLRHRGQHPAAVIVSGDKLESGEKTVLKKHSDNIISTWDMADSEYCGMMKLDILGLTALSILSECCRLADYKIEFGENLNDKKIYKEISRGNTEGCFQIGTPMTSDLCRKIKVKCFNDIVIAIALVRPGPMNSGMTEKYIKRKKGASWKPLNGIYEEITKQTYGLLVFQEQVMHVISKVAGLPESIADKIRKVIGKKRNEKEFRKYKQLFLDGCKKNETLSENDALDFWSGLLKWANYGFNMAHSVGYAMLGYYTAYMKFYFPMEFICATLSFSKTDKQQIIDLAIEKGYQIIAPKVNQSHANLWTFGDDKIFVPFTEINGFGQNKAEKYCKVKNKGFFNSKPKTKTEQILLEICAYTDNEILYKNIKKHFSIIF